MQDNKNQSLQVWNNIMKTALLIPGAKIDRTTYLKKELGKYYNDITVQKAIDTNPFNAGIEEKIVNRIADSSIKLHVGQVATLSALAGLPGGWWAAGTIPADVTQFFYNVIQLVQKLAYIYGWQTIIEDDSIDDETIYMLTLFIGISFGSTEASKAVTYMAKQLAEQVAKRLPKKPLTKYAIYNLAKQIAKWLGVKMTKESFSKALAKIIPILGGIICGSISYISMKSIGNNLQLYLSSLPLANDNNIIDIDFDDLDYDNDLEAH